jgi:hypothetical protein
MIDIQRLVNSIDDLRSDIGRVRGRLGSMDTMLLGVTILLGINCVATIIIGIAIWNTNGG